MEIIIKIKNIRILTEQVRIWQYADAECVCGGVCENKLEIEMDDLNSWILASVELNGH